MPENPFDTSIEDANKENLKNFRAQNQRNLQFFKESRGSEGFAFLPLYANTQGGDPFEPLLFQDSLDTFNALNQLSAEEELAMLEGQLAPLTQSQALANQELRNLYTGQTESDAIRDLGPLFEARKQGARASKQATLESLEQTLNEIDAIQNKKGFTGSGLGTNRLRFEARRGANTESALRTSAVNIENAADVVDVKNASRAARLGSVGLPGQLAAANAQLYNLPGNTVRNNAINNQGLFSFYRLPIQAFQEGQAPIVSPVPDPWTTALRLGDEAAGTVLNAAQSGQMLNQNAGGSTGFGSNLKTGFGFGGQNSTPWQGVPYK